MGPESTTRTASGGRWAKRRTTAPGLHRSVAALWAAATTLLVIVAMVPATATAEQQDPWEAVRQCESGGDYAIDSGNGYYGAYQFLPETWDWAVEGAGFPLWVGELPSLAPPRIQDAAAEWLRVNSGLHHWPVCGRLYGMGTPGTDVQTVRAILFPVAGDASFRNDWGEPRDNGARFHQGTDIAAPKHSPLLAAVDGVVTAIAFEAGNAGNMLVLRDADGWEYTYIHVNNDTPGTDDGLSPPEHVFGPGIEVGAAVTRGQVLAYVGDSGNAEDSGPHLHMEIRGPDGLKVNPFWSLQQAFDALDLLEFLCRSHHDIAAGEVSPGSDVPSPVTSLADAGLRGTIDADLLDQGFVDLALSPSRDGAWFVDAAGHVVALGTAPDHGGLDDEPEDGFRPALSLGRDTAGMHRVVAIESTPEGDGYWLAEADGTIHARGEAADLGPADVAGTRAPIVDMAATPSGQGAYLLTADGQVLPVGDAGEHQPVDDPTAVGPIEAVTIQVTPTGEGYWVLASDGRLVRFGDADFEGNGVGGESCLWTDLLTVVPVQDGAGPGWWVIADDSQAWAFGSARNTPPPRIEGAVTVETAPAEASPDAEEPLGTLATE